MDFTVIIGILLLLIIFFFIYLYIINKYSINEVNFKVFFLIGLYLIPMGLILGDLIFGYVGFLFMIIGLLNKKKWRKLETWSKLTAKEQKNKILMIILTLVILIVLLIFYYFKN